MLVNWSGVVQFDVNDSSLRSLRLGCIRFVEPKRMNSICSSHFRKRNNKLSTAECVWLVINTDFFIRTNKRINAESVCVFPVPGRPLSSRYSFAVSARSTAFRWFSFNSKRMDFPVVVITFGNDLTNVGFMRSITILKRWEKERGEREEGCKSVGFIHW